MASKADCTPAVFDCAGSTPAVPIFDGREMKDKEYEKPVPNNSRETADAILERCVAQAAELTRLARSHGDADGQFERIRDAGFDSKE